MYKYYLYENVFSAQFTKNSVSQIRHKNAKKPQTLLVKMLYNGNRWCKSLYKNLRDVEKKENTHSIELKKMGQNPYG